MIEKIDVKPNYIYEFTFPLLGSYHSVEASGVAICEMLHYRFNETTPSRIKPQLKEVYIALSRAIEEGDQLKIGIVLGQTLTKLESIINGS